MYADNPSFAGVQLGFVIESPTWRSNAGWGFKLTVTQIFKAESLGASSIRIASESTNSFY